MDYTDNRSTNRMSHSGLLSRDLVNLQQPLVGKTENITENSQELVTEMTGLKVKEGESDFFYLFDIFF